MGIETIGPLGWEECLHELKKDEAEARRLQDANPGSGVYWPWIYRGQSNEKWPLQTSLERYIERELGHDLERFKIQEYYRYLSRAIPAINSLTTNSFNADIVADFIELDESGELPHIELLCYARHHGFPTPMLDWSHSFYVAAFFAYSTSDRGTDPAIWAFKEWDGHYRTQDFGQPMITTIGSYVETHPRHYRQQSCYTVCLSQDEGTFFFTPHGKAIEVNPDDHRMKKFVLDRRDRPAAMKDLHSMNLTDYSLYGSEESLMRMLAYQEMVLNR
ncbi:FRG domain-containing protein [Rhizobium leguminosarum]|uniref:FRG domain-containing protein n=1 Tax=Rhizobium leguminosarum TaxID=384 RepID=UPI003F9A82C9